MSEYERFRVWLCGQRMIQRMMVDAELTSKRAWFPGNDEWFQELEESELSFVCLAYEDVVSWLVTNGIEPGTAIEHANRRGWIELSHRQTYPPRLCPNTHREIPGGPFEPVCRLLDSVSSETEQGNGTGIGEASTDVNVLVEDNLRNNSLKLFRRLTQTKHFVGFDSLAEIWEPKEPTDVAIVKALERLKAGVAEFEFDVEIRTQERRAKLLKLRTN